MARVPQAQPSVNINNYQPVYQNDAGANLSAFGGNTARGLDTLAQGLGVVSNVETEHALRLQDQDNVRETKQLDTAYASSLRTLLYGDGTAQNPGFYSLQGQHAIDKAGEVQQQIAALQDQYASQATNHVVADKFSAAAAERANAELQIVDRHVSQQRIQANIDTSNARIQEAGNNLIAGGADPKIWNQNKLIMQSEVRSQADASGSSAEVAQAQFDKLFSESGAKAIATVALSDPQRAQQMLATHLSELSGVAVEQAQSAIKTAINQQRAQQEHEAVMARLAQSQAADAKMVDYVQQLIKGQPLDMAQVSTDPAFSHDASKIIQLNELVTTKTKQDIQQTSAAEYSKLIGDVIGKSNDPILQSIANDPAFNQDGTKKVDLFNLVRATQALGVTEAEQKAKAAADGYSVRYMNGEQIDPKEIAADPAFKDFKDIRDSVYNFVTKPPGPSLTSLTQQNEPALRQRINLPYGSPDKITSRDQIYAANANGQINTAAMNRLLKEFDNTRTPEGTALNVAKQRFLDGMKSQITRTNLFGSVISGGEQYANFQQYVDSQVEAMRTAGKDPSVLFNPRSPEYLGEPGKMQPFLPTLASQQQDLQNEMNRTGKTTITPPTTPAPVVPPPIKKGETQTYKGELYEYIGPDGGDRYDQNLWKKKAK